MEEIARLTRQLTVRKDPSFRWFDDRLRVEALRLCVALAVAVAGLLGGALSQLSRLDLLPALVAIFAMGFGADVMKNIIAQRPQS